MFDLDIALLQCGAILMDSNHFIVVALQKFGLQDFFSLGIKSSPSEGQDEKEKPEVEKQSLLLKHQYNRETDLSSQ